jgi:hypothetical protein
LNVDRKKFELMRFCLEGIQSSGGPGSKVRVGMIEVPSPGQHLAL